MLHNVDKSFLLLAFAVLATVCRPADLWAQQRTTLTGWDETLMTEPPLDATPQLTPTYPLGKTTANEPLTITQLPFFDSFAAESKQLDTALWFNPGTVFRYRFSAHNPPDVGTAVMDGANHLYQPYLTLSRADYADSLESHYIDLSGFSPADSLYLSFSYQCGGKLLQPGEGDSLVLYLRRSTDSAYVNVWSTVGNLPDSVFYRAMIPLRDRQWFHTRFQIKFRNIANLAGAYDAWHLDYILLDRNRSATDTSFDDTGIQVTTGSAFAPYTALPRFQYQAIASPMTPFSATARHLQNQQQSRLFDLFVTDGVSGQQLSTVPAPQNLTFAAFATQTVNYPPLNRETFSNLASSYRLTFQLGQAGYDFNRANDTLSLEFRIDSLLAYDDGEAEAGYGLNSGRGFGQRIELQQPDTLKAVWMSFVPSIYNFERRGIFLTIWKDASRDSIQFQDLNAKISYGGAPNVYIRYPVWPPQPLGLISYVGLIQTDNRSVNIGYDDSYSGATPLIYRDSSGVWRPSRLTGALMIRPELASGKFDLSSVPDDVRFQPLALSVFPNPSAQTSLNLSLPAGLYLEVRVQVMDIQGREVLAAYTPELAQGLRFDLADDLANGLYTVQVWAHQTNGQWAHGTAKWLLSR